MDEKLLGGPSTGGRAINLKELHTNISICAIEHGSKTCCDRPLFAFGNKHTDDGWRTE